MILIVFAFDTFHIIILQSTLTSDVRWCKDVGIGMFGVTLLIYHSTVRRNQSECSAIYPEGTRMLLSPRHQMFDFCLILPELE